MTTAVTKLNNSFEIILNGIATQLTSASDTICLLENALMETIFDKDKECINKDPHLLLKIAQYFKTNTHQDSKLAIELVKLVQDSQKTKSIEETLRELFENRQAKDIEIGGKVSEDAMLIAKMTKEERDSLRSKVELSERMED